MSKQSFFEDAVGKYLVEADMEDGVLHLVFSESLEEPINVARYTMRLEKKEVLKPLPVEPIIFNL